MRIDPRDHAGRNNAALAVGVPANYTPHKIDTLASPARGLDRTPTSATRPASSRAISANPIATKGKQAMADMWKRQLEADVAAKKRAKELEEAKEREDELREERRIERNGPRWPRNMRRRTRAVDEKLRQQEADRRAHAELLEQRRLQRETRRRGATAEGRGR